MEKLTNQIILYDQEDDIQNETGGLVLSLKAIESIETPTCADEGMVIEIGMSSGRRHTLILDPAAYVDVDASVFATWRQIHLDLWNAFTGRSPHVDLHRRWPNTEDGIKVLGLVAFKSGEAGMTVKITLVASDR